MSIIEIVVIVFCVLIVGGVIISRIIAKKKGKCSCGCEDCPHSGYCNKNKNK